MKKKFFIAALIVIIISMGFLRDYIFVTLNNFIEAGTDGNGKLFLLKWVLTILFSLLYFLSTCVFLYVLFGTGKSADANALQSLSADSSPLTKSRHTHRYRQYIWVAAFSYALLFVLALLLGVAGYFFSSFDGVYPLIRNILGIAQSPIVTMILIPFCLLNEAMATSKK